MKNNFKNLNGSLKKIIQETCDMPINVSFLVFWTFYVSHLWCFGVCLFVMKMFVLEREQSLRAP